MNGGVNSSANSGKGGRGSVLGNIYVPPGCHSGGDGSEHNFSDSSGGGPSGSADYNHYEQLLHHHHSLHGSSGAIEFPADHPAHHNHHHVNNSGNNQRQGADGGGGGGGGRRALKRRIKGESPSGKKKILYNLVSPMYEKLLICMLLVFSVGGGGHIRSPAVLNKEHTRYF